MITLIQPVHDSRSKFLIRDARDERITEIRVSFQYLYYHPSDVRSDHFQCRIRIEYEPRSWVTIYLVDFIILGENFATSVQFPILHELI